jgi:hypothetical protein
MLIRAPRNWKRNAFDRAIWVNRGCWKPQDGFENLIELVRSSSDQRGAASICVAIGDSRKYLRLVESGTDPGANEEFHLSGYATGAELAEFLNVLNR